MGSDQIAYRKDSLITELGEITDQLDELKIRVQKIIITLRVLKELEQDPSYIRTAKE